MRRIGICIVAVVIVFGVLSFRVTQLQVLSGDHYRELALSQRLRTIPLSAERGSIFDRNGRDLAISIERSSVYADPSLVTDPALYASKLSPVVGVAQDALYERLNDRTRRFVYIARTIEDAVVEQVRDLGLAGVGFVPEPLRQYPSGTVASTIVGHVGGEGRGLDGLESLYDEVLQGTPGEVVVERDQRGRDIPDTERRRTAARSGTDLVLTIDQALQYQVESTLVDQVTATAAKGGMAVILDLETGDVVAMATIEGADENESPHPARAEDGDKNKPLTDLFEPGSTNKLITIATAIESGKIGPDTPFQVPSSISVGADKSYTDGHGARGTARMTTTDILRESSNVGTIMIATQAVGKDALAASLRNFGLGTRTPIDFPGQPDGLLLEPDEYFTTGLASSAIGYGVAVTALQMVGVYATFGNGGASVPPRLLDATIDEHGTRKPVERVEGERVVSAPTAATMTQMLTQVVSNGTGACAAIPGYTVAGKTGTSRKAAPEGGYTSGTMASFVGFAPADNPRFAAIVVLDEPATQYGGIASAPVFSEIVQTALTQYRVPTNDTGPERQFDVARARAEEAGNNCTVPHGAALQQVLAQREAARAAAQAAAAGAQAGPDGLNPGGTTPEGATPDPGPTADTVAADPSPTE